MVRPIKKPRTHYSKFLRNGEAFLKNEISVSVLSEYVYKYNKDE